MTRMALAAAWVWFALAEPAWALAPSAEPVELGGSDNAPLPRANVAACMCADPLELGLAVKLSELAAQEDAALKPAPGARAQSSAVALNEAGLAPPEDNQAPIAWCLSPDDPRCAPRDTGSPVDPSFVLAQLSPSGSVELRDMRRLDVRSVARFWQLGAARPGIHARVERPPR